MKINYFIGFLILVFISCKSEPVAFTEAVKQYSQKEKGLIQHQTIGEIQYSFRYIPNNYRVLKELDFQIKDTLQYQQMVQETLGQHQVLFQISPVQKQYSLEKIYQQQDTPTSWETVLKILHFRLQKDFELEVNGQWIPCRIYHLLPSLKSTDGYQFLLTFEGESNSVVKQFLTTMQFRFVDKYFSRKEVRFTIPQEILNEIPQLTIKSL